MTKKQFEELISAIRELTQAVNMLVAKSGQTTYIPYQPYVQPYVSPVGDSYPTYPKIWCQGTYSSTNSLPVSQENGK